MGTAATRATARYQKKKGLISKSYKLPREVVDEFAEACEEMELSQAQVLTKYMKYYIKRYHPDYE
ncbi:MAG: chemotaxis protein [Clostridiales bacterium]|jgi:hypothetical protein|nr:chemotaxis protein [Clostridiales bacterium]